MSYQANQGKASRLVALIDVIVKVLDINMLHDEQKNRENSSDAEKQKGGEKLCYGSEKSIVSRIK